MPNQNKNIWIIVGVIVVILVIIFMVKSSPKEENEQVPANMPAGNINPESKPTAEVSGTTQVEPVSIAYADALIKYKDRRIQLDKSCHASPRMVTYKDNTGIMVDNRSAQTRTVKIGTTFTIKPWDFQIVILPDIYKKSKTLLVDCDKAQNVATVLIQE